MTYWRAIPSLDPARPTGARSLAGGWAWFDRVERLRRGEPSAIVPLEEVPDDVLDAMTAPRAPLAGLSLDEPRLMGILNTTPDSFSDGGQHAGQAEAVARALEMMAEGADLIDIGGESTRPGAAYVAPEEEISRTAPVIEALDSAGILVSLDTRKASVARAGLDAGASILNDVSGLRFDPELADVAAERHAPLILMHSLSTPETMQAEAAGAYRDVVLDVYDALQDAIAQARAAGVARDRIVVDPGIGFGKTQAQNLALIQRLSLFHSLGCAVLLGVSRKGFIGAIGDEPQADRRGPGSAGIGLWALGQGVQLLRVHDIQMHKQAIALWRASHGAS
ncbi:dihydropteroate synthase [Gymnodinialimonas ceratoperidinii]|uniref:Dihydropteroate synthase n=1 Tax=Gymnodinialimonas ceratoperidinii TaxID=2856823 RepID=A0A8F6TZF4_9RHOB|nr:dihydropteroate synthase [Gymnodinialimonas ceratoperidinii]QXT41293.1 dihydropteroate synthase [Gymnodinialimonas ceratoperidinii]